jgi:serine/threonine protein kinase
VPPADGATPEAPERYCPACERVYGEGGYCPEDGSPLVRVPGERDPLVGATLDGRFTIIERLAEGGMGAVYRAVQRSMAREVAVKVIRAELVGDPGAVKRFLREAKIASGLSHPNTVAVLEFGQTPEGLLYLVMELLRGRPLDQLLREEKRLEPARAVRIGSQLCDALEAAHARGIVHRDLKPANVFLLAEPAGRDMLKVLDFGIAKAISADIKATHTGVIVGTPAYMAPEVRMGEPASVASDLYSLGVVFFELCGGVNPSASPLDPQDVHRQLDELGTPPRLASAIAQLVHPLAEDRFPDASAARQALATALDGWTGDTNRASPSRPTRFIVGARRRRWPRIAAVTSTLAALALAAVLLVAWLREDAEPSPATAGSSVTTTREEPAPVSGPATVDAAPTAEVLLELDSTPAADVSIAGAAVGRTPMSRALPRDPREVVIEFRRPGYRTVRRSVVPDRSQRISVELRRAKRRDREDEESFILPSAR